MAGIKNKITSLSYLEAKIPWLLRHNLLILSTVQGVIMKTTICKLPAGRNEQCVKEKKMKTKARSFVHLVQENRKKTISPSRQLRYLRPVNGTNVQDSNLLIGVRNFFSCFMFHVKWTGNFRRSVFREVFSYVIDQVFGGLCARIRTSYTAARSQRNYSWTCTYRWHNSWLFLSSY